MDVAFQSITQRINVGDALSVSLIGYVYVWNGRIMKRFHAHTSPHMWNLKEMVITWQVRCALVFISSHVLSKTLSGWFWREHSEEYKVTFNAEFWRPFPQ